MENGVFVLLLLGVFYARLWSDLNWPSWHNQIYHSLFFQAVTDNFVCNFLLCKYLNGKNNLKWISLICSQLHGGCNGACGVKSHANAVHELLFTTQWGGYVTSFYTYRSWYSKSLDSYGVFSPFFLCRHDSHLCLNSPFILLPKQWHVTDCPAAKMEL